jgi:hypothetical protein
MCAKLLRQVSYLVNFDNVVPILESDKYLRAMDRGMLLAEGKRRSNINALFLILSIHIIIVIHLHFCVRVFMRIGFLAESILNNRLARERWTKKN